MPMADSRCEMLIRRPHVRETDLVPLGQHAFGISCLNTFGDLLWCFALHRKFASQLVIRHYGSRCRWIETDGRVDLRVIHEATKLCRGIRRGSPPTHHHAHKAVTTFTNHLVARHRYHLDRPPLRAGTWCSTSCQ